MAQNKKEETPKANRPIQDEIVDCLKSGGYTNVSAFTSSGVKEDVINIRVTVVHGE